MQLFHPLGRFHGIKEYVLALDLINIRIMACISCGLLVTITVCCTCRQWGHRPFNLIVCVLRSCLDRHFICLRFPGGAIYIGPAFTMFTRSQYPHGTTNRIFFYFYWNFFIYNFCTAALWQYVLSAIDGKSQR